MFKATAHSFEIHCWKGLQEIPTNLQEVGTLQGPGIVLRGTHYAGPNLPACGCFSIYLTIISSLFPLVKVEVDGRHGDTIVVVAHVDCRRHPRLRPVK
jgi:hypothetical protein